MLEGRRGDELRLWGEVEVRMPLKARLWLHGGCER